MKMLIQAPAPLNSIADRLRYAVDAHFGGNGVAAHRAIVEWAERNGETPIPYRTFAGILSGAVDNPRIKSLSPIANALDIPLTWLDSGKGPAPKWAAEPELLNKNRNPSIHTSERAAEIEQMAAQEALGLDRVLTQLLLASLDVDLARRFMFEIDNEIEEANLSLYQAVDGQDLPTPTMDANLLEIRAHETRAWRLVLEGLIADVGERGAVQRLEHYITKRLGL